MEKPTAFRRSNRLQCVCGPEASHAPEDGATISDQEKPIGSTDQQGHTSGRGSSVTLSSLVPYSKRCAGTGLGQKYRPRDRDVFKRWKQSFTSAVQTKTKKKSRSRRSSSDCGETCSGKLTSSLPKPFRAEELYSRKFHEHVHLSEVRPKSGFGDGRICGRRRSQQIRNCVG